jgi:hypothetical protein
VTAGDCGGLDDKAVGTEVSSLSGANVVAAIFVVELDVLVWERGEDWWLSGPSAPAPNDLSGIFRVVAMSRWSWNGGVAFDCFYFHN